MSRMVSCYESTEATATRLIIANAAQSAAALNMDIGFINALLSQAYHWEAAASEGAGSWPAERAAGAFRAAL
jgi:hypothetical protein